MAAIVRRRRRNALSSTCTGSCVHLPPASRTLFLDHRCFLVICLFIGAMRPVYHRVGLAANEEKSMRLSRNHKLLVLVGCAVPDHCDLAGQARAPEVSGATAIASTLSGRLWPLYSGLRSLIRSPSQGSFCLTRTSSCTPRWRLHQAHQRGHRRPRTHRAGAGGAGSPRVDGAGG